MTESHCVLWPNCLTFDTIDIRNSINLQLFLFRILSMFNRCVRCSVWIRSLHLFFIFFKVFLIHMQYHMKMTHQIIEYVCLYFDFGWISGGGVALNQFNLINFTIHARSNGIFECVMKEWTNVLSNVSPKYENTFPFTIYVDLCRLCARRLNPRKSCVVFHLLEILAIKYAYNKNGFVWIFHFIHFSPRNISSSGFCGSF